MSDLVLWQGGRTPVGSDVVDGEARQGPVGPQTFFEVVTGHGGGAAIAGRGDGVAIVGRGDGVAIVGRGDGAGVAGLGEDAAVTGRDDCVAVAGHDASAAIAGRGDDERSARRGAGGAIGGHDDNGGVAGHGREDFAVSPRRAWQWAARYATPVWRQFAVDDRAALVAACAEWGFEAPVAVSVEYVAESRFALVVVPFADAVERLAQVDEPNVVFVDARGAALAVITTEHAVLLLRGATADWPAEG